MKIANEAYILLKSISFPRMVGSDGIEKAKKVIIKYFNSNNISVKEETFEQFGFIGGDGYIEFDKRKIMIRPVGVQNPYDIKGDLLFIDNYKNVKNIDLHLRGKILIASGGLPIDIIKYIRKKGVKGYIIISPPEKDFIMSSTRQLLVKDNIIVPGAIVLYNDAMKLVEYNGKKIRMVGNNEIKKVKGTNIIVDINKGKPGKPEILVFGHYDSVYESPGVTDNGGGAVIVASLAKKYSKNPPKRKVRFILFSGEEFGLIGSKSYVKKHKVELEECKVVINIDVAGDIIGDNRCVITGGDELYYLVHLLSNNKGLIFNVKKDIYSSDSLPFALMGIPGINIARSGGKSNFHIHTINDNLSGVSILGIEIPLKMTDLLIDFFANSRIIPIKKDVPSDIMKKVKDYFKRSGYIGKENLINN
jgi:hypothetical protein